VTAFQCGLIKVAGQSHLTAGYSAKASLGLCIWSF